MTRSEMLEKLGLSPDQFEVLLLKFRVFYASLTEPEQAVVNRAMPRLKHLVALFGLGHVSKDEMRSFLAPPAAPPPVATAPPPPVATAPPPHPAPPPPPPPGVTAFGQNGINQITNGDGDGNGNGG